jgi:hypothetical protein
MLKRRTRPQSKIASLFALLILALATSSCIHFDVTQHASIETIMQAVHDYGRGHQVLPPPVASGKPGAIPAFAEEASARFPEPDSSILYFRIVSSLACNCPPEIAEMPAVSLPKIRDGYNNVQRLYGFSNLNANRFAIMAVHLQDKASAQQAFASITTMEHDVWWGPHTFEAARTWANTP